MKQTLTDMQAEYDELIHIYFDNTSAISISKNPLMHSKMKHIPIKYHFIWEHVEKKNIRVDYVGTKEQGVDIFTRLLPRESFEYLRQRLRVISTAKLMVFNVYLICLRFTQGITIKRIVHVGRLVSRRFHSGGASPEGTDEKVNAWRKIKEAWFQWEHE
jgi:hypothetical protein